MADSAGAASSTTPKVAAAVNAAFGRFSGGVSNCYSIFGGDTYSPYATTTTMLNYNQYFGLANIAPSRAVMTPGNHDNGIGGSSQPSAAAWLAFNLSKGTLTRTTGGWINQAEGIPNTDQFIDIGGFRIILVNSGAVVGGNSNPGWPVPHTGGSITGNARVAWLRSAWAPGLKNIVITHHPRWSYYGNHHDNPEMQNLYDEILGKNDGSGPHACLVMSGHDHNMQLFQPQFASGQYPGLTQVVAGLGSTAPYTAAAGSGNTSQKSWLQFADFTAGASGFMQVDLYDDFTIHLSFIDSANTNGNLAQNTPSNGLTGAATATIATAVSAPTITYQYKVDDGSWVDNSEALSAHVAGLPPGPHVMYVKRLSGANESDVSSYAWVVPLPLATSSPVIESVIDHNGNPVQNGQTISSTEITFNVARTIVTPAGVPDTSMWLYNPDYVGCIVGASPKATSPTTQKAFAGGTREFYARTVADGKAQFNPNGKDESGTQVYPTTDDATTYVNNEIIPYMEDHLGLGHHMDFIMTFLGRRTGETVGAAELTWPATGWTAFQNWSYGDNSYVEQCINRWIVIMNLFPRRAVWRLWHEYRNSTTYVTDYATRQNYIDMFRKVAVYLRQQGVLYTGPGTGKHLLAWNPADEAGFDGTGKPSTAWFPGTYPNEPGGCDIICNDVYSTAGQTPPNAGFAQLQDWYDMFKKGSVANIDNVPIYIVEAGLDITDAGRIAHLAELIGDGTNPGLLQTNYPNVKLWTYWDGAGKELVDTPAGFQQAFRDGINAAYFLPSNIIPGSSTLRARLDGTEMGQIDSPLTLNVNPGTHTIQFWTETDGVLSGVTTFTWTVLNIQPGPGSGTYVKQIPLNKNVSSAELWVRAVGDDGVSTVERRHVTFNLTNPRVGNVLGSRGSNVVAGTATTLTFTLADIAAGNTVMVCVLTANVDDLEFVTGASGAGLTWSVGPHSRDTSFEMTAIYAHAASAVTGSPTVTISFNTTVTRRVCIAYEVYGIVDVAPLDKSIANNSTGTAWSSGLADPCTQDGNTVFALFASNKTAATNADWTPASPYHQLDTVTGSTTNVKTLMTAWKYDADVNKQHSADATSNLTSGPWAAMVVVFKSALDNFYVPGVGFDFPEDGGTTEVAIVPVEVATSDEVTSVDVTIDNTNFVPLASILTEDGIITWQGSIEIPTDGSQATITTVATSP